MTPRSGLGAVGLRSGSGPSPPPEVASRGQWWTVGVGAQRGRDGLRVGISVVAGTAEVSVRSVSPAARSAGR